MQRECKKLELCSRYNSGKPEGKKPVGRPRFRLEDHIRMNLEETECNEVDWIELAQDRESWHTFLSVAMK
uniref:(California timema) hypothetical protein n=1 Tax=Timema californicum TaxID=61474 RepID=A0A7R9IWB3_TIMCA|nr:unnamed protein product [Timema californicum]